MGCRMTGDLCRGWAGPISTGRIILAFLLAAALTSSSAADSLLGNIYRSRPERYLKVNAGSSASHSGSFPAPALGCLARMAVQPVFIISDDVGQSRGKNHATLTACVFEDRNLNSVQDADEAPLVGWPLRLNGTTSDGAAVGPIDVETGADGCSSFDKLQAGSYTISVRGQTLQWQKIATNCDAGSYCDLRADFLGKRWQSTSPAGCAADAPSIDVTVVKGSANSVTFGSVCLSSLAAFKFHDLNMNGVYEPAGEPYNDMDGSGRWTPPEPFTDLDCNGAWDSGEYYCDSSDNGKWDAGEPFTDADGDGQIDWPECPVQGWPFVITGLRADGKPVCCAATTGPDGQAVFADIAPSTAAGYQIAQGVSWSQAHLPSGAVNRTTLTVVPACTGSAVWSADRWQATTALTATVVPSYWQPQQVSFGSVGLARIDGIKEVFYSGMPGEADPIPGAGWKIDLAGVDVLGNPVVACAADHSLLPPAAAAPISIPCVSQQWYETITGADGKFAFLDLPPGRYRLTEQHRAAYRLMTDRPLLCGFDVVVCPQSVKLTGIHRSLVKNVHSVEPADSGGRVACFAGHSGLSGDVIRAAPGVLCIEPGRGWRNFTQASELCREANVKNVTLTKTMPRLRQCLDVFGMAPGYPGFSQHGTPSTRTWWPLMYEAPGTTWTLRIIYGTRSAVKLPGETVAGYVHSDEWTWQLDSDLERMKLFLDLAHQLPLGMSEVPLISDETLYPVLRALLDEVEALVANNNPVAAGNKLIEFEMLVCDSLITAWPSRAAPWGPDTGIIDLPEHPVLCKLLVDADYVGRKLDIYRTAQEE